MAKLGSFYARLFRISGGDLNLLREETHRLLPERVPESAEVHGSENAPSDEGAAERQETAPRAVEGDTSEQTGTRNRSKPL